MFQRALIVPYLLVFGGLVAGALIAGLVLDGGHPVGRWLVGAGAGTVEIGAITHEDARGKRYAPHAAAHLIADLEERGYITYWCCDQPNAASAAVARRLGYGEPRPYRLGVFSQTTAD